MAAWDSASLGPPVATVQVDLYTAGFHVTGTMKTRFRRVAEILNLTGSSHLVLEDATVTEYAGSQSPRSGPAVMVAVDEILFGMSSGTDDRPAEELVVVKRPVQAQFGVGPFWLNGNVYVPQGSRPMDVLNVADRFLPLTDVSIACAGHPEFNRQVPLLALQRNLSEILVVADDEDDAQRLAEIMPEAEAQGWMPPPPEPF